MIGRRRDAGRPLTEGERVLAITVFGPAIDLDRVRLHLYKWWPLQPRNIIMAPDGDIWFHPAGTAWHDDFAAAPLGLRALLIHELTHVWQHHRGLFLPLRRHPFCRYRYTLIPGRALTRYGIEQQATIVEHAYRARAEGTPGVELEALLADAFDQKTRSS